MDSEFSQCASPVVVMVNVLQGSFHRLWLSLADLGGAKDAPPSPEGSKFFHFHAVFGKKLTK